MGLVKDERLYDEVAKEPLTKERMNHEKYGKSKGMKERVKERMGKIEVNLGESE